MLPVCSLLVTGLIKWVPVAASHSPGSWAFSGVWIPSSSKNCRRKRWIIACKLPAVLCSVPHEHFVSLLSLHSWPGPGEWRGELCVLRWEFSWAPAKKSQNLPGWRTGQVGSNVSTLQGVPEEHFISGSSLELLDQQNSGLKVLQPRSETCWVFPWCCLYLL